MHAPRTSAVTIGALVGLAIFIFLPPILADAGWLIGLRGGQSIGSGILITDDSGSNLMTNDAGTALAVPQ